MKWITKEQVREYATTPARAFDISIKHHQQNVDATEKELPFHNITGGALEADLCGLCFYYKYLGHGSCNECPLGKDGQACYLDASLYQIALTLYRAKPFNHKAFIKAETALLNRLKQLKSGDKSMDKKQKLEKTVKDLRSALDKAQRELAEADVKGFELLVDGAVLISTKGDGWVKLSIAGWADKSHPHSDPAKAWNLTRKNAKKFYTCFGQVIEEMGGKS